ncbi:MAG: hypothetical protein WCV71_01160 [Patescibacteria group bacterium]
MLPGKNLEQQNISPEQFKAIDKSVENSLDSGKIERKIIAPAQENYNNQTPTSVVIPEEHNAVVPNNQQIIHRQVENVLSAGMENVFLSLDAGLQRDFKLKGEETSNKITLLLMQTKIKVSAITKLILEWLRIIPKINKHYLEQEAKIKTDNILKINQQK